LVGRDDHAFIVRDLDLGSASDSDRLAGLAWVIDSDSDGFSAHPLYLNFSYHSNLDQLDRACGEKEGFSEGGYYYY
jgi:hypothetical protein